MAEIPKTVIPYTEFPNEALERLAAAGLSGREFRIVLVVARKTWGWDKPKDRISMSQFSRCTGIDRRKCHVILSGLIDQKIIKKTVAVKGDRKILTYSFNDVFAEWKVSPSRGTDPKMKTVPLNGNRVSPLTATVLSPLTAHTKETDINLSKERGEEPPGLLKGQGPSPYTGIDDGMTSICTRCGKEAETATADEVWTHPAPIIGPT